jgi:hypothetical protein
LLLLDTGVYLWWATSVIFCRTPTRDVIDQLIEARILDMTCRHLMFST